MISRLCESVFAVPVCDFIEDHPYLLAFVAIALFWRFIASIGKNIPHVQIVWSKVIVPIGKWLKFKALVRAAIAADIKGNVNTFVSKLKGELPAKWLPLMEIEWVQEEDRQDFLNDGVPIIRMHPLEDQNKNFVRGVHLFFRKSLFPNSKKVIPLLIRDSMVLQVTRKLVQAKKPELIETLNEEIIEKIVKKHPKILGLLDRYDRLDKRGYFTGSFLREVHAVVTEAKYLPVRNTMNKELREILKHNEDFMQKFIECEPDETDEGGQRIPIPPPLWSKHGAVTKYAFLLVARPKTSHAGRPRRISQYVKRAKSNLKDGVNRLYVFGANSEKIFARNVIRAIDEEIPEYKLVESFKTENDYRGDPKGFGALFIKSE